MADILIRNFKMPKDHSLWLVIRPDGMVFKIKNNDKPDAPKEGTAIFLPEGYGKLVDVNELKKLAYEIKTRRGTYQTVINIVDLLNARPIIPAEGGDNNEHV